VRALSLMNVCVTTGAMIVFDEKNWTKTHEVACRDKKKCLGDKEEECRPRAVDRTLSSSPPRRPPPLFVVSDAAARAKEEHLSRWQRTHLQKKKN